MSGVDLSVVLMTTQQIVDRGLVSDFRAILKDHRKDAIKYLKQNSELIRQMYEMADLTIDLLGANDSDEVRNEVVLIVLAQQALGEGMS